MGTRRNRFSGLQCFDPLFGVAVEVTVAIRSRHLGASRRESYRDMSRHRVLAASGLKPKATPHFPPLALSALFLPSPSRDMFVPFGARRRRPFLREGPNGFILRVEVGTLDPLALSMLPSPSTSCFLCGLGLGSVRTPCSRLSETSQQQQGARRAEETGRYPRSCSHDFHSAGISLALSSIVQTGEAVLRGLPWEALRGHGGPEARLPGDGKQGPHHPPQISPDDEVCPFSNVLVPPLPSLEDVLDSGVSPLASSHKVMLDPTTVESLVAATTFGS
ncbi:hypothetical protein Taro_010483 [Colocasia esculenta]|uniref:Uncharacterized protein n=1 Tax=Colocasia esculenta TaxID=4460 RepID=A0A843U7S9_COLES|nr:hypothetical protein [Colocasia esculenta]